MNTIKVNIKDKIAVISLDRPKSNSINAEMITELTNMVNNIQADDRIGGLILTGNNGFFSAGLDLVELYDYDETQIKAFWKDLFDLLLTLSSFRKPLIGAINGHSISTGCIIAMCCDYRVMAEGKHVIGVNEISIGIIIPTLFNLLYSFWIGEAKASRFLLESKLMPPTDALQHGLIDETCRADVILNYAERQMKKYIESGWFTWQQSKLNIRQNLLAKLTEDQGPALAVILQQWWSPQNREILKTIIRNLKGSA